MELRDKTVLITGAGRGLGAAMARELAGRGANLALVDLDAAGLEDVAAVCRSRGIRAETYTANVADEADVVGTFDRVVGDFGRLDGAIANAGILRDGLLIKVKDGAVVDKLSLAQWQAVIDVNLTGVFLCGREAAERMIRLGNGGCIVNISSLSRAGNFGQSNYSAAKAGVAALTVVWAKELARFKHPRQRNCSGVRQNRNGREHEARDAREDGGGHPCATARASRTRSPQATAFIFANDYLNGRVFELDGGQRL